MAYDVDYETKRVDETDKQMLSKNICSGMNSSLLLLLLLLLQTILMSVHV